MDLKIKATNVFERNLKAYQQNKRFIINQGGTRSSKTFSLCQLMISIALSEPKTIISVIRRTGPALRSSVMKDLIGILKDYGLYNQNNHQKTEWTYYFDNGSEISFFSADNDLKLRGRAHDIVWINEANELNYDIFAELNQRCQKCIFIDFNPSDLFSYIYDLYKRPETTTIKSTYLDNPFLPDELVREIEYYKEHDPWRWKVMGLGEIGESPEIIFDKFEYYQDEPKNKEGEYIGDIAYGADWGFKDPTVIVKATLYDGVSGWELYLREILYETHLTPQEILIRFEALVDKFTPIYCDHRPEYVEMLREFNIKNANKNIATGIIGMKDCKIFLHSDSDNLIKEFRNYKWKKIGDKITDTPVDAFNHGIDSSRYSLMGMKKGGVKDWSLLF
jgi:phage terminase large subunit